MNVVLRRASAALCAALCVGVLTGGPAYAAEGSIRSVTQSGDGVDVVFEGINLADGAGLPAEGVRVLVNGKPAVAAVQPLGTVSKTAELARSLVLVMDTSGSMKGAGIDGAKAAALGLVTALPADVSIGLVSFADEPMVVVPLGSPRSKLSAAIKSLTAKGETSLYDGIRTGLRELGATGERRLLVLSDGADTTSNSRLGDALRTISLSGATVDAVGFQTAESVGKVLEQVAKLGRGSVVQAEDAAGLSKAFQATVRQFTTQLLVHVAVPAELAGQQVSIRVVAKTPQGELADEASFALASRPPAPTVAPAPAEAGSTAGAVAPSTPPVAAPLKAAAPVREWVSPAILNAALATLFIGMLGILVFALGFGTAADSRSTRVRRVMSLYTLTQRPRQVQHETSVIGDTKIARTAMEFAGRVVQRRGLEEKIALALERAAVPLKPNEWILIRAGIGVGTFALISLLTDGLVPGLLYGVAGGWIAPRVWLSIKGARRHAAFLDGLPDALQLVAGSLRAGYSLPQALDAVVREGRDPIATEMGRALAETRLGVPVEDALEHVAERMSSKDFAWVVMAIRVQREVGGNLAEVMGIVAETIRDRQRLARHVRALSAEGRISAYVLIGLPVCMGIYLFTFRGDYLRPLYTETLGIILLSVGVLLLLIGSWWMSKIAKVEV